MRRCAKDAASCGLEQMEAVLTPTSFAGVCEVDGIFFRHETVATWDDVRDEWLFVTLDLWAEFSDGTTCKPSGPLEARWESWVEHPAGYRVMCDQLALALR